MGNFNDALRHQEDRRQLAFIAALICPKCRAANRPGATIVDLETPTRAVCMVCAHAFDPTRQP